MSLARVRFGIPQLLAVVALLVAIVMAPALVASSVTSPREPVEFLQQPWSGWTFAGRVLRSSVSADAASPGAALSHADRDWRSTGADRPAADAVEVQLLYLPGDERVSFNALQPDGSRLAAEVDTPDPLAWLVLGRFAGSGTVGPIGLIDFSTGRALWDVRATGKEAETA